jgi:hypothetical protein
VFPAILEEIRKLSGGLPGHTANARWSMLTINAAAAAKEFRAAIAA